MSRSLLLIICDFLLLSLLALARFDDPPDEEMGRDLSEEERQAADAAVDRDLLDILKLSLEAEKSDTEALAGALEETRETLAARERALQEREAQLAEAGTSLEALSERSAALEEARREAEARQQAAAQEALEARRRLEETNEARLALAEELTGARESSSAAAERLRAMQEQMQRQERALETLQRESERLASERRIAEQRRLEAESQLEVAKAESRIMATSLETTRADLEAGRAERQAIQQTADRLAEGVGVLAEATRGIQDEVKSLRPMSLNALYDAYRNNRVRVIFDSEHSTLLGQSRRQATAETLLATDGERIYALVHLAETPISSANLKALRVTLEVGTRKFSVPQLGFLATDPRIVVISVGQGTAEAEGIEPFPLAQDPLRYPEAVVISSQREAYGESPFRLDSADPHYVRFQNSLFKQIFGEFSPRAGDLVMAKTGEVLGIMVNTQYGLVIPALSSQATLNLGDRFSETDLKLIQERIRSRTGNLNPGLR